MITATRWPRGLAAFPLVIIQLALLWGCGQSPSEELTPNRIERPVSRAWSPPDAKTGKRKVLSEKIDPAFYGLIRSAKSSGTASPDEARRNSLKISGNRVQASIAVQPDNVQPALAAVQSVGGEVSGVSMNRKTLQAWIPVSRLEHLAQDPSVLYIRKPAYAVPLE